MKKATGIEKKEKGYVVIVYDEGYVYMCDLIDGKWQTVYFPTLEEAEKAKNNYNEVWNS